MKNKIIPGLVRETKHCGKFKVLSVDNDTAEIQFIKTGSKLIVAKYRISRGNIQDPKLAVATRYVREHKSFGKGYLGTGKYSKKNTKLYTLWKAMMARTHSSKYQKRFPAYIGSKVCKRWLNFQKFCKDITKMPNWNKAGYQLDKDLLVPGNKTYHPNRCIFVPKEVNVALIFNAALSYVENTASGKFKSLGTTRKTFEAFEDARQETLRNKLARIKQLYAKYKDVLPRVIFSNVYKAIKCELIS